MARIFDRVFDGLFDEYEEYVYWNLSNSTCTQFLPFRNLFQHFSRNKMCIKL